MKEIHVIDITQKVSDALYEACHNLNSYTLNLLKKARESEVNKTPETILSQLLENAEIAKNESIPMCQDTGIVTAFVKIGRDCHLDGDIHKAINDGVRDAYDKYYLRKSVADPLSRLNTKDNTPAIIHIDMVEGDKLTITLAPKGAGSENMSRLAMLNPTDGIEGIKAFVLKTIKDAGGRPCPPIFLGIGIGGNFEKAAEMAKESLMRTTPSEYPDIARLEQEIKDGVNATGIGPMGLGGKTTCLGVFITTYPCHIASLPVAVNIQCHANRHVEVEL